MKDLINKIICGDCLQIMKQIPDKSIDLVLTDPPFNISGLSGGIELHGSPVNISHFGEWDYNFDPKIFIKETKRILKSNGQIYIFTSDRLMGKYIDLFIKYNFHYRNTLVWFKPNLMPKIRHHTWRAGTEFILYAGQSKTKSIKDYTFNWLGQEKMKNLILCNILGGRERIGHPTQKPLSIIKKLLMVSSNEGDIIFDPFLGSGTTAVACRELNRNFIGIEISPEYCKIAEQRLKNTTKPLF